MEKITKALEISVIAGVPCTLTPEQCAEIIARIAELESKQRWISVKERLPELDEDVFVLLENGIGYGCLYEYKGKINWHLDFDAYGNEVYYWMPIPDEPGVNNA